MPYRLLLVLVFLMFGYVAKAQSTDEWVSSAVQKLEQKNYDGAIAACTKAISINSKNAWAYYVRGIAKTKKSDADGAIGDFGQALIIEPKYASAYAGRGNARFLVRQYDDAASDYNQAISLEPDNAGFRQSLGFINLSSNNYEAAIAQFDKAIALNPHYANAYNNRGYAYFGLGIVENNYRQAIADYDKGQSMGGSNYAPLFKYREEALAAIKKINNPDVKVLTTLNWISPVSGVENLPGGVYSTTVASVVLSVRITSTAAIDASKIQVLLNGSVLKHGNKMHAVDLRQTKGLGAGNKKFEYLYSTTITVPDGKASLQLTCGDDATDVLPVSYTPQGLNLYVLAVGTKAAGLQFPEKDAMDFADVFRTQQGDDKLFRQVQAETLTGDAAKATTIADKIADWGGKQYGPNDVLFIFISSHGYTEDGKLKITGSDYKTTVKSHTTLDFKEDILDPLEAANCKMFVFLDACHSGAGIKAVPADVSNAIQKMIGAGNTTTIITSSSGEELSWENAQWQNGAFTKAIKEALAGKRGDTNGDGIVSMDELFNYIVRRVPELVKAAGETDYGGHPVTQTPKMYNPKGDVSIYVY